MDFLLRFFLIDVPEAFLLLTIGFAIFNQSPVAHLKKTVVFCMLFAIAGESLSFLNVPYQPKIVTMLLFTYLFILFLFRAKIFMAVSMTIASIGSMILAEFVILMLLNSQQIYGFDILTTSFLQHFAGFLYLFVLALLAFFLRMLKIDLRRMVPQNRHNRYLFMLILIGSIEFLLILFMNTSFFIRGNNSPLLQFYTTQYQLFFQLVILFLFIVIVYLFRIYVNLTINRVETETETPYLQSINDLLTAIRSIKHDSLNHYTAINGFLKEGMYDMGKEYVQQLLQETVSIEQAVENSVQVLEGIQNPAISALFQSKMAICIAERISCDIKIFGTHQFSFIRTYDLIKIIGNLFDNAIRASSYELEENRYIKLEWGYSEGEQYLYIENSGPTIPKEKLQAIFQLGYTTKTNGEGGVGLAVVKSVTERYGGKIQVQSEQGVTSFRISFGL
ncbi:GHKL domain-containing protein [Brevibacillus borstelensis]|uniref:sensor histidine kinase n=1 Tax=Brevibacillus borstelensis TaxID=45462 RepID=UPI000467FE58|nr:ATP-binding protein [Brevibacillus borstelensis]MCM3470933.1 ATP-binding protein [Brevibacillus borstelensis]MCM3561420.1 ATP-binding protein [Brevibacillus borstelensis]NOU57968.1 GHKL domain-containing protein [Brevibacillus borstelensis]